MISSEEVALETHLARITYGFTNPMPTTDTGPFMVTARDVNDGRILYENARRTSIEAYTSLLTDKSRPDVGDVLVTKDGTLGRIAVVDRDDVCINQSVALLKPAPSIRSRFLKYLLEEPRNHARMLGDADGTTIKHIYITRLAKMPVRVPPLSVQDDIVQVLGSLDDKIELNRRMNATLEAMAQTIFRDWFVSFGPTRRQLEGATDPVTIMGSLVRDAERARALADLFPATLAELGPPEGWRELGLDDIATFMNGLALQKYPANDPADSLPVIKIAEMRSGISSKSNRASRKVPEKYIVRNGDFLFSWSGSLLAKFWTEGEGALNQHLFKVTSDRYPRWLYSSWVHHHMPEFQRIAASKATTMGHIQREHLHSARVVVPSAEAIEIMSAVFEPLTELSINNALESRTLVATRDLLLPKLMSGEISLREAEEMLEAAQ